MRSANYKVMKIAEVAITTPGAKIVTSKTPMIEFIEKLPVRVTMGKYFEYGNPMGIMASRGWPGTLLIALIVLVLRPTAYGQQYEVSGTTIYRGYYMGVELNAFTNMFTIQVSNTTWKIIVDINQSITNNSRNTLVRNEIYWDGDQMISLQLYGTETNRDIVRTAFAIISTNNIPESDVSTCSYLWLAFCSGSYFEEMGMTNRLHPVWSVGDLSLKREGFTLPAETTLSEKRPGLPLRVIYYNDGYIRTIGPDSKRVVMQHPAPYNLGYTNFIHLAAKWERYGELELPREFYSVRYGPKYRGQNRTELTVISHIYGIADSIKISEKTVPTPPVYTGVIDVVDYRLTNVRAVVQYQITNGLWPTVNDPLVKSVVAKKSRPARRLAALDSPRQLIALLIMIILLISPLSLLASKKWQRNGKK